MTDNTARSEIMRLAATLNYRAHASHILATFLSPDGNQYRQCLWCLGTEEHNYGCDSISTTLLNRCLGHPPAGWIFSPGDIERLERHRVAAGLGYEEVR